jgi:hypothetical protein
MHSSFSASLSLQELPAINDAGGVVTLRIKQYGKYQLSVLNDRRELMQIFLTNSDSSCK